MEQQGGYTLRDVFHVLFKRKWIILFFFVSTVATGGAIAYALNLTLYESTAQLLMRPGREHVSDLTFSAGSPIPPRVNFDLQEQSERTIEMLTSRYLAEQLVERIGAKKLCRETLRVPLRKKFCDPALEEQELFDRVVGQVMDNIGTGRVGNAALVNVTFKHTDPELAAEVVNTLTALYLDRHLGVLKNPRTEVFIQEQADLLKERMMRAEKDFEDFKLRHGITSSIKSEREVLARQYDLIQAQRAEILGREAEIASRLAKRRTDTDGVETNPNAMSAIREQLVDLQRREADMVLRLGSQHPDLIDLRKEIRRVREAAIQEDIARHQNDLAAMRARRAAQDPKLAQLQSKAEELDRLEPEFDRLQERAKSEEQNYLLYMAKSEEARVSNAMDDQKIASVRVIDAARPARQPINSKFNLTVLLAVAFGALGGLVIAFGLELIGDRLDTAERAESILGLPVLTSIPQFSSK